MWWIRVIRFFQRAVDGGIPNEVPGRRMVGMAVLPIGRQHQLRTPPPNNAGNLLAILHGIDNSAIGLAEVFTKPGTHPGCSVFRLFVAFLTRAPRSHFASGEVDNTERRAGRL